MTGGPPPSGVPGCPRRSRGATKHTAFPRSPVVRVNFETKTIDKWNAECLIKSLIKWTLELHGWRTCALHPFYCGPVNKMNKCSIIDWLPRCQGNAPNLETVSFGTYFDTNFDRTIFLDFSLNFRIACLPHYWLLMFIKTLLQLYNWINKLTSKIYIIFLR
jgi:hypothetical protein